MKEKSLTVTAPGQSVISKGAEWLEQRNAFASAMFEGSLSNEFVLRCAVAAVVAIAAVVQEQIVGWGGWTVAMWVTFAICIRRAIVEYNKNVEG